MTSLFSQLKSPVVLALMGLTLAVPAAFSQTMTITGGQGQLLAPVQPSQPLTVLVLGTNGQPLVGALVTFTSFDSFQGYVPAYNQNVYTNSSGVATSSYVGASLIPGQSQPYDTGLVTANYAGIAAANFYLTTVNTNGSGGSLVSLNFSGLTGLTLSGAAGTVASTPIQIQVQVQSTSGIGSAAIPNVSLQLVIASGSTGTISCQEGINVVTNAAGVATCTPVFGTVGTGTFTVTVGGSVNSNVPTNFTVTVGPPALISILSGNNQSGTPGQQLPLPIVAQVTDLGGNPTPGISMTFTSVTPGGATFNSVRAVTDTSGKISANVVLGSVPGNIQVSVADTGGLIKTPAIFTETVNLSVTGLTINSGNAQSTFINTPFTTPLTVTVSTSAGPVAGTPVTFAVTSGSATLASPSTTTNASGQASTTVSAGGVAGAIVVTATTGTYSITFNLTANPPGPSSLSFTNAASGAINSMSPGSIVTIFGSGLASGIQGVTSAFDVGPLPLSVSGVTVQFGSAYAPIFDVANVNGMQFVSVQVPREVAPGTTNVTINTTGGGTATVPVTVLPASPGLFTYAGANSQQYLVAILANGSVASPSNPATRGQSVTIYLTGVPLTPGLSTNAYPTAGSTASPLYPLILGVANQGQPFTSVAYSPDEAGVETLTFTVPTTVTPGPVTISIGVQGPNGVAYSQGATLNVQ